MTQQDSPNRLPISAFEAAVLKSIAASCADPALSQQLAGVEIVERDFTGAGCFSTLKTAAGAPVSEAPYARRGPLDGPVYECLGADCGGGTLLWFEDGRADCLEIYSDEGFFPEDLSALGEFRLSEWT